VFTIEHIIGAQIKYCAGVQSFVRGSVMDVTERQISLSVLERLRDDLIYARLNNGKPVVDVPDLRQYIYERMDRIRIKALAFSAMNTSQFRDSPPPPKAF
jgi:hypothetical protein